MDLDTIKKYLKLMKDYELSEFSYKSKEGKVTFKKELSTPIISSNNLQELNNASSQDSGTVSKSDKVFLSPLVGIFYQSPSPNDPAFVKIGQKVSKESILCIIESMKVMNEILADFEGEITEILVKDAESIEFNQPLFKYK